ncbi:sensor histidine kinase, partial [Bacteroides nordii]|uniref:sensor histidine kinase n=1 Tax=Bacteroides nordii TaxID=291645 RepID=UPI0018AC14D5
EAFHTLFACGDSLPRQIPVVFYGIKYPDEALMTTLPNICGFTSNPDFFLLLEQANKVFPERKEVVCVNDNSFLSLKGKEDFMNEWGQFVKRHPDYKLQTYNVQTGTTNSIISSVCYPRNSHGRIVVVPKWSPFMAFIGKNSKAPFFSCQSLALTNGVFCAYDADPYASSRMAGVRAAKVLKGTSPADLGITESPIDFYYDYKQLDFFHVAKDRVKPGIILNEPHWEKYKFFFILLYASILGLLVFIVVWLIRANRREARRRMHAQTRLLVQNRLVAQRDEFDNIFHSIREGVITYDADFRIHFTNLSLLRMLHLPVDVTVRPYEGLPAGSIFKIYSNGKNVLHEMLKEVIKEGKSCIIPSNSFMQEVHSGNYFPISGEMVPIHSRGEITGVALSCHNVSDEEMRKRFFDLAIEDSSIYPWQFNIRTNIFTFPQGFLQQFGFDESVTTITREGMEEMVHPEELGHIRSLFDAALTGRNQNTRMSFRQRNADGHYEWWEYRTSVLSGLTSDEPYSILGVCQSIQRYKSTEEELTIARDKALQADKLKSAFLANMSHEIRTPLNAIVGFSDLLSDTSAFTEEEVSQFIATINKNCSLLLALINDILDLSRIESGTMDFQFARHSLPLLLKNVHDSQQLNMPPGVELKLEIPAGSKKYMVTDNVRLQQVVNNLINNAAKFTISGSITVGYAEDEPGYTSLFVEDTGKGISQDGLDHIFERFYKVDNFTQGAGLGLNICQTIVMRLNGTIRVTSEVGKGTRFTVRIPDVCE